MEYNIYYLISLGITIIQRRNKSTPHHHHHHHHTQHHYHHHQTTTIIITIIGTVGTVVVVNTLQLYGGGLNAGMEGATYGSENGVK